MFLGLTFDEILDNCQIDEFEGTKIRTAIGLESVRITKDDSFNAMPDILAA